MQPSFKTIPPLLLLGLMCAPFAWGDQLQFTFSGTGSGSLGSNVFTNTPFSITFTDTSSVSIPSGFPNDISTPAGTPAVFTVDGVGSGSLTGNQAVFVNGSENDVGIWFFAPPDFLTLGNFAFGTYKLTTGIGPIGGTGSALSGNIPTSVNGAMFSLTSVTDLTFMANVTTGTGEGTDGSTGGAGGGSASIPEPSTLLMMGAAFGCLIAMKLRRKQAGP